METVPVWESKDFTPNDQNTIKELIKRKNKWEKLKVERATTLLIFSVAAGGMIILLYFLLKTYHDLLVLLEKTLGNKTFAFSIGLLGLIFGIWLTKNKKVKESKEKFHTLRKEVVEKTEGYWLKRYGETTVLLVVEQLQSQYDIEISFKG
jgi:hypothetical protein